MRKYLIICFIALFCMVGFFGCTQHVFHKPMTISTKSAAAMNVKPISLVSTEQNAYFCILFPIISPADPRDIWDNLMQEAQKVGGNSVIDVQMRGEKAVVWVFPMLGYVTTKATGTAAVIE